MVKVTILASGIALGVYVPALLLRDNLVRHGIDAEVVLFESLYTNGKLEKVQQNKWHFHNNVRLATRQLLLKNIQEMKQYRDYMLERLDGEEWTDPSYISILFDFLFIDLRAFRRFDEMALEERGMTPTIQKAFANCMEWLDAVCNTYFKLKNSNRLRDHQKFIEILGSYIEADEHLVEQLFPANSSTEVRTCL